MKIISNRTAKKVVKYITFLANGLMTFTSIRWMILYYNSRV